MASDDDEAEGEAERREAETLTGGRFSGEPGREDPTLTHRGVVPTETPTLTHRGTAPEGNPTLTHRGVVSPEAPTLTHFTVGAEPAPAPEPVAPPAAPLAPATERPTLTHLPGPAQEAATLTHGPGAGLSVHELAELARSRGATQAERTALPHNAPAMPESLSDWKAGDVIDGKYEVREKLGQGGMGVVWKVHHRHWRIDLAVKIPTRRLVDNPHARQRFLREAETWVALGVHPNIVQCWYVRELGGIPRLFLDHVPGGTLKDAMRSGKIAPGQWDVILDLMAQACDGLGHAHAQGVVHRDVKPANLLLDGDLLKVTDFGLVRQMSETDLDSDEEPGEVPRGATQVGSGLGTAEYGAPEQWLDARRADHRADIYALGMTFFEMAVGRRAFDDGRHDEPASSIIARHLTEPAPDPRQFNSEVPAPVAELILRCLEKDPARRPGSTRDLRGELAKVHEQVVGHPLERTEPRAVDLRAEALNNRAVSLWDLGKQDQAHAAWTEALKLDPAQLEAFFNRSLLDWRRGRVNADFLLARLHEAKLQHKWAGIYAGYFQLERLSLEDATRDLAEALADPHIAEDGAPWRALGHALLAQESPHDAEEAYAEALARAPLDEQATQGRELAQKGRWDLPGGRSFPHPRFIHIGHDAGSVRRVSASANGDVLVAAVRDGTGISRLLIWEKTFDATAAGVVVRPGVEAVSIDPGNRLMASAGSDGSLQIWNLEWGNCRRAFREPGMALTGAALSADGRWAVTIGPEPAGRLWDLTEMDLPGSRPAALLEGHTAAPRTLAPLPEGARVAIGGEDGRIALFDLAPGWFRGAAREPYAWLTGLGGPVLALSISGDGRFLGAGGRDGQVCVWELATGNRLHVWKETSAEIVSLAWSREGLRLLASAADRTLRMFALDSGKCERLVEGVEHHQDLVLLPGDVVVAHDGRRVVALDLATDRELLRAPLMCSRAREHHEEASLLGRFRELMDQALAAERAGNRRLALAFMGAARSVPGYERDPDVLELSSRLSVTVPRRNLIGCWLRRTIGWHPRPPTAVAIAADGQLVVTGSEDETVRVFKPESDSVVASFQAPGGRPLAVAISPDSTQVVAASEDGTLKVFEVASGRLVRTLGSRARGLTAAAITRDASAIVGLSAQGEVQRWAVSGSGWDRLFAASGRAVAAAPDGTRLAVAAGPNVLLWRPGQTEPQALGGHTGEVRALAFTPDGRSVLSAAADHTVRSWDVESGGQLQIFLGHDGPVEALCVTPDGRFAFSGGRDGAIQLWNLAQPISQRAFPEGSAHVTHLALTPDGRFLVSVAQQLKLWELDWEFLSQA